MLIFSYILMNGETLYLIVLFIGLALLLSQVISFNFGESYIRADKPKIETDVEVLRFQVIGDFGNLNPHLTDSELPIHQVAKSMNFFANQNPISMVLTTGDNFYSQRSMCYFNTTLNIMSDQMNYSSLKTVPWYLLYGNHDCYNKIDYGEYLELIYPYIYMPKSPWNMTVQLNNFSVSFTFLPCDFSCIGNSILYRIERQCAHMGSKLNNFTAYKWLDKQLTEISKEPKIKWKVVLIHYPIFSVSASVADNEILKKYLFPILAKHKVDLVISGHNHNMQLLAANISEPYKNQKLDINCLSPNYIKCNNSYIYCLNKNTTCPSSNYNCEDKITFEDSPTYYYPAKSIKKGSYLLQVIQGSGGSTIDYLCPNLTSPMADMLFGKAAYGFSEFTITSSSISINFIDSNTSTVLFNTVLEE